MSNLEFPWQALKVVCDGTSILDIASLNLKTESEAYQFVLSYGFDLYEEAHIEQVQKNYSKACSFIQTYLCTPEKFPKPIASLEVKSELITLLLLVSGVENEKTKAFQKYRAWACSVLRVMHVISHAQSDLRLKYLPKIKRQTVDRVSAHIQVTGGETFLGFENDKVPLVTFEKKEVKVRDAVLLKLLHKASATAQEIYDHIGVRFVTKTRLDSMKVIKYLIDHHLIAYPNVMGARCRNTLLTLEDFQGEVAKTKGDQAALNRAENNWKFPDEPDKANPFSASSYRSIQFTARQLIRIPVVRKGGIRREMTFFFPFEIQIFDEKSYSKVLSGQADHEQYKKRQLDVVKKRVLGELANA